MRDIVITLAVIAVAAIAGYKVGQDRAETRCKSNAVIAQKYIKDAVSRAAQTLADTGNKLTSADQDDRDKLKEIEDEAAARGTLCYVPADRLRVLDTLGG